MSKPEYRICLARLAGYSLECQEMGSWLMSFANELKNFPQVTSLETYIVQNPRIRLCRNMAVAHARETNCNFLFFIDPDVVVDRYVNRNPYGQVVGSPPAWFPEAWKFILRHPGSVVAAPYCGKPPNSPVHVFCSNEQGELVRVTREKAAVIRGWSAVRAVGTGCMLIDMAVFDRLEQPYFSDRYRDASETKLQHSQDVEFCHNCEAAGVPIYVDWDCWCGHWQNAIVEKPGIEIAMPPEPPVKLAQDPSVPVLVETGAGDLSWR